MISSLPCKARSAVFNWRASHDRRGACRGQQSVVATPLIVVAMVSTSAIRLRGCRSSDTTKLVLSRMHDKTTYKTNLVYCW